MRQEPESGGGATTAGRGVPATGRVCSRPGAAGVAVIPGRESPAYDTMPEYSSKNGAFVATCTAEYLQLGGCGHPYCYLKND